MLIIKIKDFMFINLGAKKLITQWFVLLIEALVS